MEDNSSLAQEREDHGCTGPRSDEQSDAVDAARWRALMASERIRIMGSAGFKLDGGDALVPARDDLHIGVELWSKHKAAHPSADFPQDPMPRPTDRVR
jgi:hypothetical protein